jgi:hypothetical protein
MLYQAIISSSLLAVNHSDQKGAMVHSMEGVMTGAVSWPGVLAQKILMFRKHFIRNFLASSNAFFGSKSYIIVNYFWEKTLFYKENGNTKIR